MMSACIHQHVEQVVVECQHAQATVSAHLATSPQPLLRLPSVLGKQTYMLCNACRCGEQAAVHTDLIRAMGRTWNPASNKPPRELMHVEAVFCGKRKLA